jgi:hypothetical protein
MDPHLSLKLHTLDGSIKSRLSSLLLESSHHDTAPATRDDIHILAAALSEVIKVQESITAALHELSERASLRK